MNDNKQFFAQASQSANANFMSADGTQSPINLDGIKSQLNVIQYVVIFTALVTLAHFFYPTKKD
jgi:hypothetical protein